MNDEIRMTNDKITSNESQPIFGVDHSFGIRHSCFVIQYTSRL